MDNSNNISGKMPGANPLSGFYRQPGAYIALPSGGRFYEKNINLSDNKELAVYPMTAKDELSLKNPDALYNGESLKAVLKSIVPDIEDVNEIPAADIDMILVAMRMVSYGDELKMTVNHVDCEKNENGTSQTIGVSLGSIIATLRSIPENIGTVTLGSGVTVHLRPYNLADQSLLLREQFVAMRSVQAAETNATMTADKKAEIANQQFSHLVTVTTNLLSNCVLKVVTPDGGEVTNRVHIKEWLANLDRASIDRLDKELKKFQEFGIIREIESECEHCKLKFKTDMLFDPTSFFTAGS